tara:strand:- start:988 stop:1722 length:735 start_codon:yes stop_codon:yes gene_type:complete
MNAPCVEGTIVLAHGMLGVLQAVLNRDRIEHYFQGIPEWLRAAGNDVVITLVPGIGSIERRAEALKAGILAKANGPVHVIGHSQGGLDARHMITHLGMAGQVRSLTTIGTPHRGSPIAELGVTLSDRAGVLHILENTAMDTQAFHDLQPGNMALFNERTPNVDAVRYRSVTGAGNPKTMFPTLRLCHRYIQKREGQNDGLVSTASAAWGEEVAEWPGDHANQIGLFCENHFDWRKHWGEMLSEL